MFFLQQYFGSFVQEFLHSAHHYESGEGSEDEGATFVSDKLLAAATIEHEILFTAIVTSTNL